MGLLDRFKKPQPLVSKRKLGKLADTPGAHVELLEQPLFGDLAACMVALSSTDVDIARLNSRGYTKRIVGGRASVTDRNMKKLFHAVGIDERRLLEDGYINQRLRRLSDTAAVAKRKGETEAVVNQCQSALNMSGLTLARHILEQRPEFGPAVPDLAAAVKAQLL